LARTFLVALGALAALLAALTFGRGVLANEREMPAIRS
jgi:hypothetical protein